MRSSKATGGGLIFPFFTPAVIIVVFLWSNEEHGRAYSSHPLATPVPLAIVEKPHHTRS